MRSLIKQQLASCNYAAPAEYDKQTNTYKIPKYSKPKYDLNASYIIKIPQSLVGNIDSVLATNWNHGTAPTTEHLKIYVSKVMGRMIYVDSAGFDLETKTDLTNYWSGWLATDDLTQIIKL